MNTRTKVGLVAGGWIAAIASSFVATWLYNVRTAELPYDTSGGMYAGGEMLTGIGAFLFVGLVPVILTLWFMRRNHRFWNVIALAALAFAAVGLVSVLASRAFGATRGNAGSMALELLGLAQLLGIPLWLGGCLVFAFLAPTRFARRTLFAAVAIEVVIGACAVVHWFTPRPPI
jgi:hypothetical protein